MLTALVTIRSLAVAKKAENVHFRRYLADHHISDELFHSLAKDVEAQIDCRDCGNCCRETQVGVSQQDISHIAAYLGIDRKEVLRLHTALDPSGSGGIILKNLPDACTFLDGNLCRIYEARPPACHAYPHLDDSAHSVTHRMANVCQRASICPIVYHALEIYKHRLGFHPHPSAAAGSALV